MAKAKKRKRAKGAGRPKGSTTRGPTVAIGFRMDRDLFEKFEQLRKDAEETLSRTVALQRLVREELRRQEERRVKLGLAPKPALDEPKKKTTG